ncbi:hypothetical protein K8R43_06525 [archaeon]|nr:hypothetical protein [archaeon]
MYERATALKIPIKTLLEGEYHQSQSEYQPNHIIINNQKISRINIIARINKEDLTIDDGTGKIKISFFGETPEIKDNETVRVIGKIREQEGKRYLSIESIVNVNEKELELRQLELKPSKPLKKEEVKTEELEIEELEI